MTTKIGNAMAALSCARELIRALAERNPALAGELTALSTGLASIEDTLSAMREENLRLAEEVARLRLRSDVA